MYPWLFRQIALQFFVFRWGAGINVFPRLGAWSASFDGMQPDVLRNCSEEFLAQRLDHFGGTAEITFQQRYFLCNSSDGWFPGDPIFLYIGNEADVELYVNATGLMWDWSPEFRAKLVFVEHRYFGKSEPVAINSPHRYSFLTVDQALADFAAFVPFLRTSLGAELSPIIGFGGSYGGMLCAWLRISSPWTIDACLAASAPIMSFEGLKPPVDPNFFAKAVTADASVAGGCSDSCKERIQAAWRSIQALGDSEQGRKKLQHIFTLCGEPTDAWAVIYWISSALDYMAMGSYPYSSSYMLNGRGTLPPYPLRKVCSLISGAPEDNEAQLQALLEGAAIFYNATGAAGTCFNISTLGNKETTEDSLKWNYIYCSGVFQTFGRDGKSDMYWESPWNSTAAQESCMSELGILPDPLWISQRFGGWNIGKTASRILFSNGGFDPWARGGITESLSPELPAILIPEVGHHMDLFWARSDDPPSIIAARAAEMAWVRIWLAAASAERRIKAREPSDIQI